MDTELNMQLTNIRVAALTWAGQILATGGKAVDPGEALALAEKYVNFVVGEQRPVS